MADPRDPEHHPLEPESSDRIEAPEVFGHRGAVERALRRAVEVGARSRGHDDRPRERLDALLALPSALRFERLSRDASLRTFAIWEGLRERVDSMLEESAAQAADWARLAVSLASHLDPEVYGRGLVVECQVSSWVISARCLMALGDAESASPALELARHTATTESGNPYLLAEIALAWAELHEEAQRPEAALAELATAGDLYREACDEHRQGIALVRQGLTLQALGRAEEARSRIGMGLVLLRPEDAADLAERGQKAFLELAHFPEADGDPQN